MPTVSEIEQALFRLAPKELAMAWDNVGHLEGNPKQSVQRLLVALDVTEQIFPLYPCIQIWILPPVA